MSLYDSFKTMTARAEKAEAERDAAYALIGTLRQDFECEELRNVRDCDMPQHDREINKAVRDMMQRQTSKIEAERDALKCCGNCCRYVEDRESYKCDHPGPYELLIKTYSCPSPWNVCPEWKAREK